MQLHEFTLTVYVEYSFSQIFATRFIVRFCQSNSIKCYYQFISLKVAFHVYEPISLVPRVEVFFVCELRIVSKHI